MRWQQNTNRNQHMPKIVPFLLIAVAFCSFGWAGYDHAESGEEFAVFDLEGQEGSSAPFELVLSMSPMRLIFRVAYEIELADADNKAFTYDILVQGPGGLVVFKAIGEQRDKRNDNTPEFNNKTEQLVLGTFEIPVNGIYVIDWRVTPRTAKIGSQKLILKQQVSPLQWPLLLFGILSFVLGVFAIAYLRLKSVSSAWREDD
jgi:hypothetical protein